MSQEQRRPRPAPEPRAANVNSVLSIAVAVLAVLLGFFILRDLRNDSGIAAPEDVAPTEEASTETTVEEVVVQTTAAPVVLTAFKVQVANASGVSGSAGLLTTEMQGKGYIVQPAINKSEITPKQTVTVVYYLLGSEAAAAQVAQELGGVATSPMPTQSRPKPAASARRACSSCSAPTWRASRWRSSPAVLRPPRRQ